MARYRGQNINLVPTDGMKAEAERALAWKAEGKRGGTRVGLARANQLKNKTELSPSTVRRMFSFFSRHEVDKQAQGFSPGEEGYPSPGRVAWALWGGDAGFSWSRAKVATMDRLDKKSMDEEEDDSMSDYELPDYPEEEEDDEEDDDEIKGTMIMYEITNIMDVSKKLHDMLGDDDNLPGHVISKIILGTDYIRDARDYIKSEGYEKQLDEEYDYEGGMAKSELMILINAAKEIESMMTEEISLPKYVVSKVILACTYIKDAYEYLQQETKAEPGDLKVGDFVQWNSSGGTARGKIKRIVRNGETGIQGIAGTPDNPAAVIAVWRKMGEGYEESDVEVAHKFSTLRKIESLMKQDKIYTLLSKIKAVSQDSSTITIRGMASTSDIDRTGDIIEPSAWQKGGMKNYLNNPIILFNHDYNRPIGRGTDLKITDTGLEITAKISKADPYIAQLITDGVLSTFSVGFKVKDADYMKDTGGLLIKDAELYEISVVSVPANQAATFELVKSFSPAEFEAYKKGLIIPESGKLQAAVQPKGKNMDEQELSALIAKQSAVAVKMALAERDAIEKKAREEAEKQKAQEEAIRTVAASAGASGAEKLLQEVKNAFDASRETTQKEIDSLKAALQDRAAEVAALQNSKRAFVANTEKDWKAAAEADLRDAYVLGAVLNKGWNTKFGKSVIEKANTMSGTQVPADVTISAYETIVSTAIERDIQNGLILAPLFREIQMNAASMVIPILPDAGYAEFSTAKGTAAAEPNYPHGNLAERGDTYGSPYGGVDLTSKTITTKKLISLTYLANETEEDAIVAILPLLNESMVRSHQRAVESAMLLGGATSANAGLTGAFSGLVKHAIDNDATFDTSVSGGVSATPTLTAANMLDLRKRLGKYGISPRDVVFIVNQVGYFNLLEDGEFQDMNLVGPIATKLTGEVGNVYGSRVLLCDEFKTPASGTAYAMAVNPRNYIVPRLRGVTIESQYIPRLQHRELVATQRLGFDTIITAAPSASVRLYAS